MGLNQDWYLIAVAAAIGLLMGVLALAFIKPIQWLESQPDSILHSNKLLFFILVPVAPVVGALLAGCVMALIPYQFKGHGVSTVMFAVHRKQSRLPLTLAIRHWITSTLTIGSGGSAGPEGPIVTIGATIGSSVGRGFKADPQHTATLLGCGAAAGLASVFNAPIAAIFFVLEVLLRDFSLRTLTPITVASVISAATTQTVLGTSKPLFGIGPDFFRSNTDYFTVVQVPTYIVLGVIVGLLAVSFILMLKYTESLFDRIPVKRFLKPAIGAIALGIMGLAFLLLSSNVAEQPPFYGNGYLLVGQLLKPEFYNIGEGLAHTQSVGLISAILLVWLLLKMVATCFTLGSGGAGGLFAPSLVLGALIGGMFGTFINWIGWIPTANPAHYALVGMAAMVAATTHAPLTGILLVYEITRNYSIIMPLMLTAVIATIAGRLLYRDSIYTLELSRIGIRIGSMSDLTLLRRMTVRDVPLVPPVLIHPNDSGQRLLELSERFNVNDFIVVDQDENYVGMVGDSDLRQALIYREAIPLLQVDEIERTDVPVIEESQTLDMVIDKFSENDVQSLPVVKDGSLKVIGVITRTRLMREYQKQLDKDQ